MGKVETCLKPTNKFLLCTQRSKTLRECYWYTTPLTPNQSDPTGRKSTFKRRFTTNFWYMSLYICSSSLYGISVRRPQALCTIACTEQKWYVYLNSYFSLVQQTICTNIFSTAPNVYKKKTVHMSLCTKRFARVQFCVPNSGLDLQNSKMIAYNLAYHFYWYISSHVLKRT